MTLEAYVSELFGIDSGSLFTNTRRREVVNARQVCMYIRREAGHTFEAIGRFFGKDHATAVHSCYVTKDLAAYDKNYRELLGRVLDAWYDGSVYLPLEADFCPSAELSDEERVYIAIHG